jgi:hypothetical protein
VFTVVDSVIIKTPFYLWAISCKPVLHTLAVSDMV